MAEVILYRFFKCEQLLYVGITSRIPERFREHRQAASFFELADRVTMQRLPDRAAAMHAERCAIQAERPIYNIVHNSIQPQIQTQEVLPVWIFRARGSHEEQRHGELYLDGELDGLSCVQEVDSSDGDAQVEYYCDWIRRNNPTWIEKNAAPIYWSVLSNDGLHEQAPFQRKRVWDEDFLTFFTWPEDRDGARIDWFRLPRKFRFSEFWKALGWTPSALQRTAPIADLIASREGRARR